MKPWICFGVANHLTKALKPGDVRFSVRGREPVLASVNDPAAVTGSKDDARDADVKRISCTIKNEVLRREANYHDKYDLTSTVFSVMATPRILCRLG